METVFKEYGQSLIAFFSGTLLISILSSLFLGGNSVVTQMMELMTTGGM